MRNFTLLDQVVIDSQTGIIGLSASGHSDSAPSLALKIEGDYIAISASYGALEIALRPRLEELKWALAHMQPLDGLQTTSRQVGSTQSYLAFGLRSDGTLTLRPTILTDATGHITINLRLSNDARTTLYTWLNVTPKS
ncbi:MAG: hypothetical protein SF162_18035 [bacterium]|nr:hypothetical protein [bacterium]